jgi:hypothetical protein
MPNRTRQPEIIDHLTSHLVALQRRGGAEHDISATSPGVLLSPVARALPAPVPASTRALALDGLRIARLLRDPGRRPARWNQPGFGAEVELIRRHLAPIRTRRTLAASYAREAFHLTPNPTDRADPSPTRLAYALRWLELRDGATGPSWQTLLS